MNNLGVCVAGAQEVIHDLNRDMKNGYRCRCEINVTFRGHGGAVGRRDFATHLIHWYPAKMFHRIPSVFLNTVELPPNATILDPFCGSGTVLLEANLRGHDAVGVDINPLARLISRVKVTALDPGHLNGQVELLIRRAKQLRSTPAPELTLDSWLSSSARIGLHRLAFAIKNIPDDACRSFFLVTLTSIVRRLSNADPAIPSLVRLRKERAGIAGTRYRNALERSQSITTSTVYSAFADAAAANIHRMSELYSVRSRLEHARTSILGTDAAHTGLASRTVDAIITSPPYCGAQKYVRSMKLELIVSGFPADGLRQLDRRTLGTEAVTTRDTELSELLTGDDYVDDLVSAIYDVNPVRARMASDYSKYLVAFAHECKRVLRPGGHLLVTLGRSTLSGMPFLSDHVFRRASQETGLDFVATLVDRIPSRGLLTKRHSTAGRIDHEFIVWMRCPPSETCNAS